MNSTRFSLLLATCIAFSGYSQVSANADLVSKTHDLLQELSRSGGELYGKFVGYTGMTIEALGGAVAEHPYMSSAAILVLLECITLTELGYYDYNEQRYKSKKKGIISRLMEVVWEELVYEPFAWLFVAGGVAVGYNLQAIIDGCSQMLQSFANGAIKGIEDVIKK